MKVFSLDCWECLTDNYTVIFHNVNLSVRFVFFSFFSSSGFLFFHSLLRTNLSERLRNCAAICVSLVWNWSGSRHVKSNFNVWSTLFVFLFVTQECLIRCYLFYPSMLHSLFYFEVYSCSFSKMNVEWDRIARARSLIEHSIEYSKLLFYLLYLIYHRITFIDNQRMFQQVIDSQITPPRSINVSLTTESSCFNDKISRN